MDERMRAHAAVLDLQSRLFLNCLEGMDDATARRRLSPETNSAAFVALHLLDARHFLARVIGAEAEHPYRELLAEARGVDDVPEPPPLEDVRGAWGDVSKALRARMEQIGVEELDAPSPQAFPVDDGSVLGAVAFLLHHDAYHLGQLGLMRKHSGLAAMSYV